MTPGQRLALQQVETLARDTHTVEIVDVQRPSEVKPHLILDLSLYTGDMPRSPQGLRLRDRERILVWIDPDFPYAYPAVSVRHRRFAGFPHVQWGTDLCMYQAPSTEWSPRAGMIGFMDRVEQWFRMAAADQLDPVGGALHPPVAYTHPTEPTPLVIARRNTPAVQENQAWLGFADLNEKSERRVDLVGWSDDDGVEHLAAPAVLLHEPMPFEFPNKVDKILESIENRGVASDQFFSLLHAAIRHNGVDRPLYVVVGTPMRGISGGATQQHLTVWKVDTLTTKIIDLDRKISDGGPNMEGIRAEVAELFSEWARTATVAWCSVREDRSQVTMRRDADTPLHVFKGTRVEVWGCGALGSHIAEMLVRAGVKSITLRDHSLVSPGVLVRQQYVDSQIGRAKSPALAAFLKAISPDCEVKFEISDILKGPLADGRFAEDADIVVDTTAAQSVLLKSEEVWRQATDSRKMFASLAIDRTASFGMATFVRPDHMGGPFDVTRRLKLEACNEPRLAPLLEAFFPTETGKPFQPEPGCSDATFVGSAADIAGLSSMLINFVAAELACDVGATAVGAFGPIGRDAVACRHLAQRYQFESDICFQDPHTGFETRIDPAAWREMRAWTLESARTRGPTVETGGLLFGETDDLLKVTWVSEVCGPPPDSQHSPDLFVCGIEGTNELNQEKLKRTRGSVRYVGTWHIHPESPAIPSNRDLLAMQTLLSGPGKAPERLLLLIIGTPNDEPTVSASMLLASEFEKTKRTGVFSRDARVSLAQIPRRPTERDVAVALSGGGSRAIAFQLGCLRALKDRGILSRVDVFSTVSGGSVLGAMYAYSSGTFEEFDRRAVEILRTGLTRGILRRAVLSHRFGGILGTQVLAGVPASGAFASRFVLGWMESLFRHSKAGGSVASQIQPPFRRWVSRTDAFIATLRDKLFGDAKLNGMRRDDVNIVINACELRTGTAFRFGNRESGSWRFGTVEPGQVDVALAVGTSAAYPLLLPAIDRFFSCSRAGEPSKMRRHILTDGGVYENLGLTCLEPGKDPSYSTNVYQPKYIICCDAGSGEMDDVVLPYGALTRVSRSFRATHRQVQHGLQGHLHAWKSSGDLRGFVYAYLGQLDGRLPVAPPDLISRDDVRHYPTDFSPMSARDIDLLSTRGYQLTRLLLSYHCPNL